jgi:hypothetical protein
MFSIFGKRIAGIGEDATSTFLATLDASCLLRADERLDSVRIDIEAEILRQHHLGTWQRYHAAELIHGNADFSIHVCAPAETTTV